MKRLILLLTILSCQNLSFSKQDYTINSTLPISAPTVIEKEILPNGNYSYSLISNKILLSNRVDVWEDRFLLTYPEIISIELSDIDQSIHLTLNESHSLETLDSILKRFDVTNYSIQSI